MQYREAVMRTLARHVFYLSGMHEENLDDCARITFENMLAAGIESGFRAFEVNEAQKMSGRIDNSFVIFSEPRIV